MNYDHDWIIVGSGFGGSVSALRLAEKGYDVKILECGRRFEDDDFAESMYRSPHRYFWSPFLKLRGIFRMTFFKDVTVLSGSGVGGGSLGYANTLYRARDRFFTDRQWAGLEDWANVLTPHYEMAEHMLGVTEVKFEQPSDNVIRQLAEDFGVPETYKKTRVGVYFGEGDKNPETVPDPYFGGEGPDRAACIACGACMMGCRYNAKNTLVKNYLWFAEKRGVKIDPLRTVTDIKPIRSADGRRDGSAGYEVTSVVSGAWFFKKKRTERVRGVVVAAGTYGTNKLLVNCRERGSLARLSHRLGELVRTNSEAILAVTAKNDDVNYGDGSVAISSSFFPDEDTHIENVTYGQGGDLMGRTFTLLTGKGNRATRPMRFVGTALLHPLKMLRLLISHHWSRRTIILLVMQTLDNSLALRPKKNLWGGWRLGTEEDPENPNPRFIEAANKAAELTAEHIDGVAQSSVFEVVANVPTTAHFMGGAVIGADPNHGVVDRFNRAFGYDNMLICDGSTMPANPGVNPSLTITAISEHAMSAVPPRVEAVTGEGLLAIRAENVLAGSSTATVAES